MLLTFKKCRGENLSYLKLVVMIFGLIALSIVGSIIGMFFGAIVFPMKVLDGRCSFSDIKDALSTGPNGDKI
jgi:hypothetical protein